MVLGTRDNRDPWLGFVILNIFLNFQRAFLLISTVVSNFELVKTIHILFWKRSDDWRGKDGYFLADPPLVVSSRFTHVCFCVCVVSWLNCLISLVLDEIPFWNLLEKFLRCSYISSKYFQIYFMGVSLLVGLLPCWNKYKYRDISSSRRYIFLKISGDIPRMNLH